ncbi:MAG: HAD family phosphatase [Spirochaetota bacterium]
MSVLRAVFFDWGGVVIDDPAPGFIRTFADHFHIDADRMKAFFSPYEHLFQTGRMTERELWEKAYLAFGKKVPEGISLWKEAVRAVFIDKPGTIALVHTLKSRGIRTALVTNTEVPTRDYYFEKDYPFDRAVFSCDEGSAKPDELIYRRALERVSVTAAEAAFIDDKPANVEAAVSLGMRGILFTTIEDVTRSLADVLSER